MYPKWVPIPAGAGALLGRDANHTVRQNALTDNVSSSQKPIEWFRIFNIDLLSKVLPQLVVCFGGAREQQVVDVNCEK